MAGKVVDRETKHLLTRFQRAPMPDRSEPTGNLEAFPRRAHSTRRRRRVHNALRLVVNAAPSAMVVLDSLGRILLANTRAERTFSYGRGELLGRPIEQLVPAGFWASDPGSLPTNRDDWSPSATGTERELTGIRQDNSQIAVAVGITPFRGRHGVRFLTSIVDVTRRRQEAEWACQLSALAHLSRVAMLGELSASLAHELNQPLTAILSNVQAAQRFMAANEPDLDEVREILAEIVDDDNRASAVIRRLRVLFRNEGRALEPVEIGSVLTDVAGLIGSEAVLRHIQTAFVVDRNLPLVLGDRVQLQQVVMNLVLNAFDAVQPSPEGERCVTARALVDGQGRVEVKVRDSGSGLFGNLPEKVFEPFFTTKPTGMGIGLSICRSIVEAHGGAITAENNPEGGATFWFTLPPAQD
jgi:two-component system, LuxR family, sensor kinase FixL